MAMHDLDRVGEDYPTSGPNNKTLRQPVRVPASTLFNCLADGPAWKEWLGIDVEWTSPEPHGVGTTRTVRGKGQTFDEHFLTWDEGQQMSFRFDRASLPFQAFAERYDCVPTAKDGCNLVWSYAFEWRGPLGWPIGKVFGAFFAFGNRRALRKLSKLLASDPQRFARL